MVHKHTTKIDHLESWVQNELTQIRFTLKLRLRRDLALLQAQKHAVTERGGNSDERRRPNQLLHDHWVDLTSSSLRRPAGTNSAIRYTNGM